MSLPNEQPVTSPFTNAESAPELRSQRSGVWIVIIVALFAACVLGAAWITQVWNDPYRTLEPFPVAQYLDSHQSLLGARFQGKLRVEADLGWKDSIGKLMLFSSPSDSRPLAVLIPAAVAQDIYFTKGQVYQVELEVKEGGLIYANSLKKN